MKDSIMNYRSYFPIRVRFNNGDEAIFKAPEDIINGRAFRVIETQEVSIYDKALLDERIKEREEENKNAH